MAIEIHFDPNQPYQREAIDAVLGVFKGQEAVDTQTVIRPLIGDQPSWALFGDLAFPNVLTLDPETMRVNLRAVQDTPVAGPGGSTRPSIAEPLREPLADGEAPLDLSVEMETGTGKTYVYLRTIAELYLRYGFRKFVVVVPSVAIREGVLSQLRLVKQHFRELYDGLQYDSYVYDSTALTRLRQFATAPHLQILVMNIDAFSGDGRIISRESDALNGYAPIDFIQSVRPIVIMDEPQNLESDRRRQAIANLNPLVRLRYSATHRYRHHLVHRLTPVDAYDQRLVKRIDVLSVTQDEDLNVAWVEVRKLHASTTGVTATLGITRQTQTGLARVQITARKDDDLFDLSGGLDVYRDWAVEDIHTDPPRVEFRNGRVLLEGYGMGPDRELHQRAMIRQAVEEHLDRELDLHKRAKRGEIAATKPLTLIFIDRVENYAPSDGRFRLWFEEEYAAASADRRYRLLQLPAPAAVHSGYFARSAKGEAKDVTAGRDTKEANEAFKLIMTNKERLLDFQEPVRFLFSHSALSEGWDNPNVFVICNLQDGKSDIRRRQQIGRGLRLPVMSDGNRCHVEDVNHLTVVANESFQKYADALQQEIEEETGESFAGRIRPRRARVELAPKKGFDQSPAFRALWDLISPKTEYAVTFDTERVVAEAVRRLAASPKIEPLKLRADKYAVTLDETDGVGGDLERTKASKAIEGPRQVPDILGDLSRRVALSRSTIARILRDSGRLEGIAVNPAAFMNQAREALEEALAQEMAKSIVYTRRPGEHWDAADLKDRRSFAYEDNLLPVKKSIYSHVAYDSNVERAFAAGLDARDDVELFIKLPGWFKVSTPIGGYNPDWAILKREPNGAEHPMVRETKGTSKITDLHREPEQWKIQFAFKHFGAIEVDYNMLHKADEV